MIIMLYHLDELGKINWVSNVRLSPFELGFGYAWVYQGVGDEKTFIRTLHQRLIDCRWQNWQSHIQSSDRFDIYKIHSSSHVVKKYLSLNIDRHLKFILTRFRFGVSEINVHACRYKRVCKTSLLCPLCKESDENEVHFALECSALSNLRVKFIPRKFYSQPCLFRVCLLMASDNENILRNLAMFLYKAFQLREKMLS